MLSESTPESRRKYQAWQERSAKAYRDRHLKKPRARSKAKKPARNDSSWRDKCVALYGDTCIVPGCGSKAIEMNHIRPRSQGGHSVTGNGLPMCGAWSKTVDGGHHGEFTAGTLRIDYEWLTPNQRTYLRTVGWVDWDEDGQPVGEGWRHFTERTTS